LRELLDSDNPLIASLVRTRVPVLVESSDRFELTLPAPWNQAPACSLLFLPLFGETAQVTGFVCLERSAESPFTQQDRELGALLSSLCSEILRSVQASEALVCSEQRYRLLADNVADIIWTVDT